MRLKNFIVCLLLVVSIFGTSSCGITSDNTTDTTAAEVTDIPETQEEETVSYLESLPKEDLNGYTFRVIGQSTLERQNFHTEEKEGDSINDAIFERDLQVTERLNIVLEYIALADRVKVAENVINTVLADDPAYDMAITAMSSGINLLVPADVCYDLNEVPYISIDGGLWDASIHNNMSFLGKQYFTTGVISAQFSQSPVCCVFNKRLAQEYSTDNIYDIVLDGRWTIDFMHNVMKDTSRDLDGDNIMTINDFYGFAFDRVFGNSLFAAAGYNPIVIVNDVYSVNLADETMMDTIDRCSAIFKDPTISWHNKASDGSSLKVFREGRSIFSTGDMLDIQKFRDMEDDFGIIPTPKLEESQDKYITSCTTWLPTGIVVTKNCQDIDNTGLVMETMAAVSDETIVPAVYETTLQGKVSRDDKSSQMLDLIFENPSYDFITVFNFQNSSVRLGEAILGWAENWTSTWETMRNSVEDQINDIMKTAE